MSAIKELRKVAATETHHSAPLTLLRLWQEYVTVPSVEFSKRWPAELVALDSRDLADLAAKVIDDARRDSRVGDVSGYPPATSNAS